MKRPGKQYKVLFPYNRDNIGGSYISSSQLARYLKDHSEFEPVVALPRKAGNRFLFEKYGLKILEHGAKSPSRFDRPDNKVPRYKMIRRCINFFHAWYFLKKHQPDLVHVQDDNSFYIWGQVAKRLGIPTIWHVRLEHVKPRESELIHAADHIICISRGCVRRFQENEDAMKRVHVIYNGIDLQEFASVDSALRAQLRKQFQIASDAFVGVFIGNLVERKRPEWAMAATKALWQAGVDAHLIYIGEDRGAIEYETQLMPIAEEMGKVDKVRFLGIRKDVGQLLNLCDFVMVPSVDHGEPFSRVVAEACAKGLPVVASSGVGALELLKSGEDCISVDSQSADDFAGAVVELWKSGLAPQIGAQARICAQDVFSDRRMGAETLDLYRTIFKVQP